MSPRAPRALSPAQRDALEAADDQRVYRTQHPPTYWWTHTPGHGTHRVTASVHALLRAGLLETGPFVALGTPRLAVVTDAGRAMLTRIREREEAQR